jgi:hypothetical protein
LGIGIYAKVDSEAPTGTTIGNWELELLKNQSPKVYNKVLMPNSNAIGSKKN